MSGYTLFNTPAHFILQALDARIEVYLAVTKTMLFVDSLFYIFTPIIFACVLRLLQRRVFWHRWGGRTLVVADVPYVHQCVETFVSKMFSLAFGIATIQVHGAGLNDHFVHRFTHRVVRGVLIAIGRPDGRLFNQTKAESWALLALMQAKCIQNYGVTPEVVSIGHNGFKPGTVDRAITLPTSRPPMLVEKLEDTAADVDPNQLWAARRHMATNSGMALHTKSKELLEEAGAQCPWLGTGLDLVVVRPPEQLAEMHGPNHVVGVHLLRSIVNNQQDQTKSAFKRLINMKKLHRSWTQDRAPEISATGGSVEAGGSSLYGEDVAMEALAALGSTTQKILEKQSVVEQLVENRFQSAERLVSWFVMFHAMGNRVSNFWPLKFDTFRSQSGLRIATTAAPITASDLLRSVAEIEGAKHLEEHELQQEREDDEKRKKLALQLLHSFRCRKAQRAGQPMPPPPAGMAPAVPAAAKAPTAKPPAAKPAAAPAVRAAPVLAPAAAAAAAPAAPRVVQPPSAAAANAPAVSELDLATLGALEGAAASLDSPTTAARVARFSRSARPSSGVPGNSGTPSATLGGSADYNAAAAQDFAGL